MKREAWNSIRARIEGDVPHITVWINDQLVNDYTDTANHAAEGATDGMIAITDALQRREDEALGGWRVLALARHRGERAPGAVIPRQRRPRKVICGSPRLRPLPSSPTLIAGISQAPPTSEGSRPDDHPGDWTPPAFAWKYAVFEIPGGGWGSHRPRRVLMRIVPWWSLFTAATGWAWNGGSLIVTRALFGAGEAGVFPNLTRMLTTWLPKKERERAQALVWLATRISGASRRCSSRC